jgi:hypothetical protein
MRSKFPLFALLSPTSLHKTHSQTFLEELMMRLVVNLCGLCEAEVDVVNLMEEMKITPR